MFIRDSRHVQWKVRATRGSPTKIESLLGGRWHGGLGGYPKLWYPSNCQFSGRWPCRFFQGSILMLENGDPIFPTQLATLFSPLQREAFLPWTMMQPWVCRTAPLWLTTSSWLPHTVQAHKSRWGPRDWFMADGMMAEDGKFASKRSDFQNMWISVSNTSLSQKCFYINFCSSSLVTARTGAPDQSDHGHHHWFCWKAPRDGLEMRVVKPEDRKESCKI